MNEQTEREEARILETSAEGKSKAEVTKVSDQEKLWYLWLLCCLLVTADGT